MDKEGLIAQTHGHWQIEYGEVNRLQRIDPASNQHHSENVPSQPSAGFPFYTGAIFTFNTSKPEGSNIQYGNHGHSYIGVVSFGDKVEGRSVMTYGQNRNPHSPHYFDQALLYSQSRLKPILFEKSEIERQAKERYNPGFR